MEDVFIENASAYAAHHQLQLAEQLGFGIHGIIFVAENKSQSGRTAIKAHRETEPYFRECMVYERLKETGVTEVLGFNVPQLIRTDDTLRIIEMSIVKRPFVLDFAGAYLDQLPDFSEEIWTEWETGKRDQFEAAWSQVKAVLTALEDWGIYMVDVSPSNVALPN